MNKIKLNDLNKLLKECRIGTNRDEIESTPFLGVHHYNEWDHGYDAIYGYNGARREFYEDTRKMTEFLIEYFETNEIKEIIIAPCYRYNQFDKRYGCSKNMPGNDIFYNILEFLHGQGVKKGDRTGIKMLVDKNISILEMILEGSFRGVSELCLFSFENKVLIEPTHHFELIFWTNEVENIKKSVNTLLHNYSELKCFGMVFKS